jgi:hypothetical protein
MGVLSYTNAFPGIPAPQHLSGQTAVQNYVFPGALQPQQTGPAVLSWTNAFLGIPAPQHLSGQTSVQDFNYPGALQPLTPVSASSFLPAWAINRNFINEGIAT